MKILDWYITYTIGFSLQWEVTWFHAAVFDLLQNLHQIDTEISSLTWYSISFYFWFSSSFQKLKIESPFVSAKSVGSLCWYNRDLVLPMPVVKQYAFVCILPRLPWSWTILLSVPRSEAQTKQKLLNTCWPENHMIKNHNSFLKTIFTTLTNQNFYSSSI